MRALFAAFLLSSLACATGRIPNTDVPDTSFNREIIAFCERYRRAVEARDTRTLLSLASPRYFEDGGTPAGDDDYGYEGLRRLLDVWREEVKQVRYEIRYRRITVDPQDPNRVHVDYTYSGSYTLQARSRAPEVEAQRPSLAIDPVRGPVTSQEDNEAWYRRVADNRLELERSGNEWRIVAGM